MTTPFLRPAPSRTTPSHQLLSLAVRLFLLLPMMLVGCDDDDDNYTDLATVRFFHDCPGEQFVDIYVDGDYVCTVTPADSTGCQIDLVPGFHTYYAEGPTFLWGDATNPLDLNIGAGTLAVIDLSCP